MKFPVLSSIAHHQTLLHTHTSFSHNILTSTIGVQFSTSCLKFTALKLYITMESKHC